nr:immunoglobulin heavy chain junction region [Mus musculus]
TVQEPILLTT